MSWNFHKSNDDLIHKNYANSCSFPHPKTLQISKTSKYEYFKYAISFKTFSCDLAEIEILQKRHLKLNKMFVATEGSIWIRIFEFYCWPFPKQNSCTKK